MRNRDNKIAGLTLALLAGALGCAGTQKLGQTSGTEASDEDMPTAEDQPETQGTEPLIAELGRRGEGELGPNPLMH